MTREEFLAMVKDVHEHPEHLAKYRKKYKNVYPFSDGIFKMPHIYVLSLLTENQFLKGDYSSDNSMLAQWLRVIDGLNKENPVPVPKGWPRAVLRAVQ